MAAGSFDALGETKQGRFYARRVEGRAIASWLFSARKGRLTPDLLRRRLKAPEAAKALLASIDREQS